MEINEQRLLNSFEDHELPLAGFAEVQHRGAVKFQFINDQDQKNFGCNDYMVTLIKTFVEDILRTDAHEESKESFSLSVPNPQDLPMKKTNSSLWEKLFGSKIDDEKLAQLVELGYDIKIAKKSLQKAKNDLDKALDIIRDFEIDGLHGGLELEKKLSLEYTSNPFIKLMMYVSSQLEQTNRRCLVCQKPLEAESIKPRTCSNEVCEYVFEEGIAGSVLTELKLQNHEATLDISIAAKAILSSRNLQIFEPFPSFFLKGFELRGKRGNLDEIKKAQLSGIDVAKAKKTDEKNKDINTIMDIFVNMPHLRDLIVDVTNEDELIKKLQAHYKNEQTGFNSYKLLRYILATNRSTIRLL